MFCWGIVLSNKWMTLTALLLLCFINSQPKGESKMSGLQAKRIVVPVDFSELSLAAVQRGVEIVDPSGTVNVIHVLPAISTMEPGNLYGTITDESRIDAIKEKLRTTFAETTGGQINVHCQIGDAGREIVEFAQQENADLIVIPSHGYGFFKHMLLGSVAERVVRLAHCPVLVLRS